MQIIGGTYRGKKLTSPEGTDVRPTSSRSREALFNMLTAKFSLQGKTIADLFCGTGALGIEAISRGASHAIMADKDTSTAKKNITTMKLEQKITFIQKDILAIEPERLKDADIIFMDPPYNQDLVAKTIAHFTPHLKKDTLWAIEIEKDYPIATLPFVASGISLKILAKTSQGVATLVLLQQ